MKNLLIPEEKITQSIFFIRDHKVMLDCDLAALYGVETRALIQAVQRNLERFPSDFMFQVTPQDFQNLRSQIVISREGHGGRRYRPYVFTEQGVAMLSGVLHSPRAIAVNIAIMRTFVQLRNILATHRDLAKKLEELEGKYDSQFKMVFDAIRQLMTPSMPKQKRRIGFRLS